MNVYYKEKTPIGLNSLLITDQFLKDHYKLIPSIINLLRFIGYWNQTGKKQGQSSISRTIFYDRYRGDYPQVIKSLEYLGLLTVTRYARQQFLRGIHDKGQCYTYSITDLCYDLLNEVEKEYLYKLFNDPKEIRKNQKRISDRGHNKVVYGDIRDDIKTMLDNITINIDQFNQTIDSLSKGKRFTSLYSIRNIKEKQYDHLKNNESDNRIATPYTTLPKEVRNHLLVKGYSPLVTVDIRSCHPSLFGHYIMELNPSDTTLQNEVKEWKTIFLNKDQDPKTYLSTLLSIPRDQIKTVMLEYFNGQYVEKNKSFMLFNKWLKTTFPNMYRQWRKTKIKETGTNLSKRYETKIMLDPQLFKKATDCGYILGQEYDGFTIFGKDPSNVNELVTFLKQRTKELIGIDLIYSVESIK
jgi:hypothetical protein